MPKNISTIKTSVSYLLLLMVLLTASIKILAQNNNDYRPIGDARIAMDFFNSENYRMALEEYKLLYKKDSLNIQTNHYLAICYLNTNIDKKKALPLLKYVTSQQEFNTQAWYDLGRAYRYSYEMNNAIGAFNIFDSINPSDESNYISAKRQIEMCKYALELMNDPINVTFQNLGPEINSPYPDFNPCISEDEDILVFTSKRFGNMGSLIDFDGYNTSDIYYSEYKYGLANRARRFSPLVNTPYIEECTSLSADGKLIFVFVANQLAVNDVLVSTKRGRSFQRAESPGETINQVETSEYAASISPDGKYLFFSSDRPGGIGGKDIYYANRLPSGGWSSAKNAGDKINTFFDEDFPYLSPDGETFYFCSLGHKSIGGYDIFKSEWNPDEHEWSEPENIGFPVNTVSDNFNISFTKNGRHAYVSMFKDGGVGDLDIYRVTFNDIRPEYTVVKCTINKQDSSLLVNKDIILNIYLSNKDEIYGQYSSNENTGVYTLVLRPGEYEMKIEAEGYDAYKEVFVIPDRGSNTTYEKKQVILNKTK